MGELRKLRLGNAENVVTPYTAGDETIIIDETTKQIRVNPEEIATQDDLDDVKSNLNEKADIIISSAEGAVASFSDGAEYDAVSMIAHFEPYQEGSGDPSPDNVRPIHGWTGLNIIRNNNSLVHPDNKENPMEYYGKNSTNVVQYNSTENAFIVGGGVAGLAYAKHSTPSITGTNESRYFIAPADMTVTVYVEYKNVGTDYGIRIYKDLHHQGDIHGTADNIWHQDTKTLALQKGEGIRILMYPNIYWKNLALYYGSTATPYEPYNGTTTPISWQTEAGEVFGGYVDVTRGKVQKTLYSVDLGTLDWVVYETGSNLYRGIIPLETINGNNGEPIQLYCSALLAETLIRSAGYLVNSMPVNSIVVRGAVPSRLYVKSNAGSASAVKESLNGVIAVYELATPIEYDITPAQIELLKGYNNVWNSTGGNNEVEYRADTKLYIDGKQLDIRNTIAPIEDGDTASQAYAVGRYFYRNGAFCKAKTAIASGAAFTLGTNYEVTTVSAELYTALH